MTQDEIIEMARQAGFTVGYGSPALPKHEAFAKLVAERERERITFEVVNEAQRAVQEAVLKEREACARVCDDIGLFHEVSQGADLCFELGKAIRARAQADRGEAT